MAAPAAVSEQDKARGRMMMGAMTVMGACIFGGLTAVVLMALGQRVAAGAVAIVAAMIIVVGLVVQVSAGRKLKAASQRGAK